MIEIYRNLPVLPYVDDFMAIYVVASMKTGHFMIGTAEWIATRRDYDVLDRHKRRHNRASREMNRADSVGNPYFPKPYRVLVLDGDEARAEEIRAWLGENAPKVEISRENYPDGKFDLYRFTPAFLEWCRAEGGREWDGKTDAALLRMGGGRPRAGGKIPPESPPARLGTLADRLARPRP